MMLNLATARAIVYRLLPFDDDEDETPKAPGFVAVRELRWYLLRQCSNASLPQIAATTGESTHSTIIGGIKRVEQRIESDPSCHEVIDALATAIIEIARLNGQREPAMRRTKEGMLVA